MYTVKNSERSSSCGRSGKKSEAELEEKNVTPALPVV